MAGNALPLVLLAGAAFLLTRKKGDEGAPSSELPSDQGQGTGSTDIPAQSGGAAADNPDLTFDPGANMPWVETIDDYQQWTSTINSKQPMWLGTIEFLDMNDELAEVGKFIENEMSAFGNVYGRTVDRSELDPVASEAMMADNAMVESGITQLFSDNPGLVMAVIFTKPEGQQKMAVFLLFEDAFKQQEAITRIAQFKQALAAQNIDAYVQPAHIGMNAPSVIESVKAFLHANLPKSAQIGGLTPVQGQQQGGLNP